MKKVWFSGRLLQSAFQLIAAALMWADIHAADGHFTNETARIEFRTPERGKILAQGEPIPIEAIAVDPRGYIPRLAFYSSTNFIGVSEVAFLVEPQPGTPVHHSVVWSNAPIGRHLITASGINNRGEVVYSGVVPITVVSDTNRVALALEVIDGVSYEYEFRTPGVETNASFRIRRVSGPTNVPVSVSITLSGTADPFSDYKPFFDTMQLLLLPAGKASINVGFSTIADDLVEGDEIVFVTINPLDCGPGSGSNTPLSSCYEIVGTNRVGAIIHDTTPTNQPPRVVMNAPQDGGVFDVGQRIHVAASATDPDGISYIAVFLNGSPINITKRWGAHLLNQLAGGTAYAHGESC
jgi:hypothetical protein